MSVGLALSGGGAKGAAHIGVLQALIEENIPIDYISGASMGSLVAALYAAGYTPNNILDMIYSYFSDILNLDKKSYLKILSTMVNATTPISGVANGYQFKTLLKKYFYAKGKMNISEFNIPISIPTVDILTGKLIYFSSIDFKNGRWLDEQQVEEISKADISNGLDEPLYEYSLDIASIVKASCSFPGIFEPEVYGKYMLVDGGLRKNIPVSILKKMGATKTIAVCFDNVKKGLKNSSILTVAMKCVDIMGYDVCKEEVRSADFVIKPNIGNVNLIDFNMCRALANQGYKKTKELMPEIKEIINKDA